MTTQVPETADVMDRLNQLEADNRALKRRLAAVAVLGAVGMLYLLSSSSYLGAQPRAEAQTTRASSEKISGTMTMEHLVLVDPEGRKRLEMGLLDRGCPGINLYDEDGKTRIDLHLTVDAAPHLDLINEDSGYVSISANEGGSGLVMRGKGRGDIDSEAELLANSNCAGVRLLTLGKTEGKSVAQRKGQIALIIDTGDQEPQFSAKNGAGKWRARYLKDEAGIRKLILYGEDGGPAWQAP